MYANVLIEYPVKSLDKCFTYFVPKKYENIIKRGMKVLVPFGKQIVNGIVLDVTNHIPEIETKEILTLVNPEVVLTEKQIKLGYFLKEKTLCSLITAFQTMLPSSLKVKDQKRSYDKYETYIYLNEEKSFVNKYIINHQRALKQIEIIEALENKKVLKKDYASNALNILISENIVKEEKKKVDRISINNKTNNGFTLNDEQQRAYEKVDLNKFDTYLLEGVTGSGKTEVYMHLIDDVLKLGKSAIVLVPEICLTTQTVNRFYNRYGCNVAVFHSSLSDGEKYDEYLKIYQKRCQIVVGTRSSVFVPLDNLGIIIMDEEHSENYKQESNPRYSTIDMAKFRCQMDNIPLILASATPSLESRARAQKEVYKHLLLKSRANNLSLPKTVLVDMHEEVKQRNFIFSNELKKSLTEVLMNKEQAILLLNRRGFSTYISCSNCGFTYKCPNCDITLTYHKTSESLRCHYCSYMTHKDDKCPSCHEKGLTYLGLGTEKLEEELKKLYPTARIIRMDQDTTSKKGSYQKILDAFGNYEYDILLGTQMISKGLDFKKVTLVGVINADTSLDIPDFRANERTFSLLYQTSGRAGRYDKEGKVVIQTFNIEHPILKFIQNNDYSSFYNYEMNIRHKLCYPPYKFIATVQVKSKDYDVASKKINEIKNLLQKSLDKSTTIIGPAPAAMFKVNNIYNFQLIIKYTNDEKLINILTQINDNYNDNKNVNVDISFDPLHF